MQTENIFDVFPVSFVFNDTTYRAQVELAGTPENSYYIVNWASAKDEGQIPKLIAIPPVDGSEGIHWQAPGLALEHEFLQVLGDAIARIEM